MNIKLFLDNISINRYVKSSKILFFLIFVLGYFPPRLLKGYIKNNNFSLDVFCL